MSSKVWRAWGEVHNSHGPCLADVCWMPDGDRPEVGQWERMPWMDSDHNRQDLRRHLWCPECQTNSVDSKCPTCGLKGA